VSKVDDVHSVMSTRSMDCDAALLQCLRSDIRVRRRFVVPFSVVVGENQMMFRILSDCLEKNAHFKLIYVPYSNYF